MYIVFHLGDCHGPHVVGEKVFHIEGKALLSWEEYGFRIRVQESIKSGAYDVTVKAIVAAGQIDLPEGCELVSAVYDISLSRKLTKLITIEIEHCAKLENEAQCEYLSFVTTQHDDQFKLIEGGMFCPNTQYGALCCNSFSKKSIVKRHVKTSLPTRKYEKSHQSPDNGQPSSKEMLSSAKQYSQFDGLDNEPEKSVSSEPNECSSQEKDSKHKDNSHSATVVDAKLHPDVFGEAATISTLSSEQQGESYDISEILFYYVIMNDSKII